MAANDEQLNAMDYEINLKERNILLPYLRQQGPMNACYAYTVGEAISALFADIYGEEPIELSTQQFVDYIPIIFHYKGRGKKKDRFGCYYSNHRDPLTYAQTVGLCKDEDYVKRRTRRKRDIQHVPDDKPKFYIGDFCCVYEEGTPGELCKSYETRVTEAQINEILRERPMVGAIKLYRSFDKFKGKDIYMGPDEGEVPEIVAHSLLIIGYGVKCGIRYFVIKNSNGVEWGDEGFAKVRRDLVYRLAYPLVPIKSSVEPEKVVIPTKIKNINKPKVKWHGGRPKTSQSKASPQAQSSYGALRKRSCTGATSSGLKRKHPAEEDNDDNEARKVHKTVGESDISVER